MSFFEREFPRKISQGATGGPGFNTSIKPGFSGFEQRQGNWSKALGKWACTIMARQNDASIVSDFDALKSFHLVVSGKLDAFRFFDPLDHSGTAQLIGTGDGTNRVFQLVKVYTNGSRTYTRTITKPITSSVSNYLGVALSNTVVIYDNGSVVSSSLYDVDYTTGVVTFHVAHAPLNTHLVTADFQFHTPVRFDNDEFRAAIKVMTQTTNAVMSVSLDLVEVRL